MLSSYFLTMTQNNYKFKHSIIEYSNLQAKAYCYKQSEFSFPPPQPHSQYPTHCIFLWQKYLEHIKPLVNCILLKQCAMLKHTLAKEKIKIKIVQCVISPSLRNDIFCYVIVHMYGFISHNTVSFSSFTFNLCRFKTFSGFYWLFWNLYCFSIVKVPGTLGD